MCWRPDTLVGTVSLHSLLSSLPPVVRELQDTVDSSHVEQRLQDTHVMNYQRIIHQQAVREAEGYLDLAMGFDESDAAPGEVQRCLAQRALEALERLPDPSRQRSHVAYLTGQAYRVMHRYGEAIAPLSQAAQRDPDNIFHWLALAWCFKRTDHLDRAIESLENALAAEAGEAIVHYNLACYWSLAGQPPTALRYLARALEIDPNYREMVGAEPDFDPIRDLREFQLLVGQISDSQLL